MDAFPYDVFISYRAQEPDAAFARQLRVKLEADGYRVALDKNSFDPKGRVADEIERCTRESRFTLAIVTPRYFNSSYTTAEAQMAMFGDRRRLIPLWLEEVEEPKWIRTLVGIFFDAGRLDAAAYYRLTDTLGSPRHAGGLEQDAAKVAERLQVTLQPNISAADGPESAQGQHGAHAAHPVLQIEASDVNLFFHSVPNRQHPVALAADVISLAAYATFTQSTPRKGIDQASPYVFRGPSFAKVQKLLAGIRQHLMLALRWGLPPVVRLPTVAEWSATVTAEEMANLPAFAHFGQSAERIGSARRRHGTELACNAFGYYDLLGNYPEAVSTDDGDIAWLGWLFSENRDAATWCARSSPRALEPRKLVDKWTLRPVVELPSDEMKTSACSIIRPE